MATHSIIVVRDVGDLGRALISHVSRISGEPPVWVLIDVDTLVPLDTKRDVIYAVLALIFDET